MIDRTEILVKAGDGGNGAIGFRREKFVPFGGPDGGDGGNGGNVVLRTDVDVTSLEGFRYKSIHRAGKGQDGRGKKKHGKKGGDLVLRVPVGTVVWERMTDGGKSMVVDMTEPGQEAVVARGGKGGWGNTHYVSSVDQAPHIARNGEAGEERSILLELRLIADAGIIGYPNVGKSSLLAAASAARPRIAGYAFTTLEPMLGVVTSGRKSFIMAEIPGLIEGAHAGRGLGHDFLQHAIRTKIFIHLIDGNAVSPVEDMARVNSELSLFDRSLGEKPQLVAVNKIDIPEVRDRLTVIGKAFRDIGLNVAFVSAATGDGVGELMARAAKMLEGTAKKTPAVENGPQKVFRPRPKSGGASISRDGGTFVIGSRDLESLVVREDAVESEAARYFLREFDRLGITRALVKAGIKPGDRVRCGRFEWEW